MSKSNSTLRNYSFNMVGSIWEAFTDVACMAIIARYLDLSLFGDYAFVMAFVAIFRVVCGASLPVIITREIAVNKENGPSILTAGLVKTCRTNLDRNPATPDNIQVTTGTLHSVLKSG